MYYHRHRYFHALTLNLASDDVTSLIVQFWSILSCADYI